MHSDIINMQRRRRDEQNQRTRNGLRLSKHKVDLEFAPRHCYKDLSNHLMFWHWSKTRRPVTIMIVIVLGPTYVLQPWNYMQLPTILLFTSTIRESNFHVWLLFKVNLSACTGETEDRHYFLVTMASVMTLSPFPCSFLRIHMWGDVTGSLSDRPVWIPC